MVNTAAWLLDTNILSEAMRPQPSEAVMAHLLRYEGELALAAPVWHELRFGWLRMANGRRKDAIGSYIQNVVGVLPVLPYDGTAARIHAELRQARAQNGQPLPFVDGQIASVAMAQGLTLVTRNTADFTGLPGLRLANWFEA
jgi:tRNA(fMet)-specific endonuclease VapC